MARFFQWLIFGHVHHWQIERTAAFDRIGFDGDVIATGRRYYLQCQKCGDVRKRTLA